MIVIKICLHLALCQTFAISYRIGHKNRGWGYFLKKGSFQLQDIWTLDILSCTILANICRKEFFLNFSTLVHSPWSFTSWTFGCGSITPGLLPINFYKNISFLKDFCLSEISPMDFCLLYFYPLDFYPLDFTH